MMFGEHPGMLGRECLREDDGAERLAPPASPSNSWSSAETLPAPSQEQLGGADEPSAPARPKRCKISREQLDVLVKSFEEEPLPNFDQRQAMAKQLLLVDAQSGKSKIPVRWDANAANKHALAAR